MIRILFFVVTSSWENQSQPGTIPAGQISRSESSGPEIKFYCNTDPIRLIHLNLAGFLPLKSFVLQQKEKILWNLNFQRIQNNHHSPNSTYFSFLYLELLRDLRSSAVHGRKWIDEWCPDLDKMSPPLLPIYLDYSKNSFLLDHSYSYQELVTAWISRISRMGSGWVLSNFFLF